MNVDTDRATWIPEFLPHEMATIADELHANSVLLLGHDIDRLVAATAAADAGLVVWFEARRFDSDAAATLEFLSAVAAVIDILETEGVHGMFIYDFIAPASPHIGVPAVRPRPGELGAGEVPPRGPPGSLRVDGVLRARAGVRRRRGPVRRRMTDAVRSAR